MKILMAHFREVTNIAGGLEHVLCNFSNAMNRKGHEVHIAIYDSHAEGRPYYPLDNEVKVWNLRKTDGEPKKVPLIKRVQRELVRMQGPGKLEGWYESYRNRWILPEGKKLIEKIKPEVIVVYWHTTSGFVKALAGNIPVITMIHSFPDELYPEMSDRQKEAISESACIQCLTRNFKGRLEELFPSVPVVCIPNVVPQYDRTSNLLAERKVHKIICMARLSEDVKRPHLLIEAFSRVAPEFPTWQLFFWGDGKEEYKQRMQEQVSSYHLEKRVHFCGVTSDVLTEYCNADIFAIPSRVEGFGLAPAEAMSAGVPVVAYASCAGVNEVVENGKTGLLVEDGVEALAEGLKKLMQNTSLRAHMGNAGHEAMKQYAPEKIWSAWDNLLNQVVRKK